MPNLISLRKAPLAAAPMASSLEYDGNALQLTDETGARTPIPRSGVASAIAAMAVPATGVAYVNTAKTAVQIASYGGTVTVISVTRGVTTVDILSQAAGAVTGSVVTLAPGDAITFTYTVAPAVNIIPL